jgi:hypothetical protein
MISVYGQRATMVSFSALLTISLAFAHLQIGWDRIQYSGLLLLELILPTYFCSFFYIRPHRYAELQIAQCIKLTSNYLKLRGDLWNKLRPKSNHRKTIEFTGSTKHYSRKHKRSASGIELIPVLLIRIENAFGIHFVSGNHGVGYRYFIRPQ